MSWLSEQIQPFLRWLLRTSVQASVLILLILLLQAILGRKLGVRWQVSLWLILLIRLILPWAPKSPVTLYALVPESMRFEQAKPSPRSDPDVAPKPSAFRRSVPAITKRQAPSSAPSSETKPQVPPPRGTKPPKVQAEKRRPGPVQRQPTLQKAPQPTMASKSAPMRIADLLPLIWLAGALVLAVYVFISNFRLWRIIRRERPYTKERVLEILENCKAEMGVQTIVGLVVTGKIKNSSLFGFVRPRLLVPRHMIENMTPEELRHIFLHELAHLKRLDIYLGWLTSFLQVFHWFNPFVWFAFHRMRADRELACDAMVLSRRKTDQPNEYGQTIIRLIERFYQPRRLPSMAGILESKSQLKRRITMIARFKKPSYRWSPPAVAVTVILAFVSLSNARYVIVPEIAVQKPPRRTTLGFPTADNPLGETWYVDDDGPSSGDGLSPETAFQSIQEGIDAASNGDNVVVAQGVYLENINLNGKNIVLRSSDPMDPDVVANTIIDGQQAGPVVKLSGDENETCVISGFTIQNGQYVEPDFTSGGGIHGGAAGRESRATIRNNVITGNQAFYGGGIAYCDGLVEGNLITGNLGRAREQLTNGRGAGLFDCNGTIRSNTITENHAGANGGGLHKCHGTIENNLICGNSVGGSISIWGTGAGLSNCDGLIRGNVITGNWAGGGGGGLQGCDGSIVNCTISGNAADGIGGGLEGCNGTIVNCIIWGNTAMDFDPELSSTTGLTYCCIKGGAPGEGNINPKSGPVFVDADGPDDDPGTYEDNDYGLLPDSPCIDAGLNEAWMAGAVDLDGNPRISNDTVDIGAYEYTPPAYAWSTDCRFFRVGCVEGAAPENLAITSDDFGQTFLEFDTVEGNTYVIESTDSFSPPAWTAVWTLPGDGLRATWLTTRRWSRTFGGERNEEGYFVELSPDGGYVVATSRFGTEPSWGYLIKTDADGNQVWARTFEGHSRGEAKCVRQTSDGGYILAGSISTGTAMREDVLLLKTDSEGNEVWSRTFGGTGSDYANSVQQTSDGGYIVAGHTLSFGAGGLDAYLIKTDADGNEVWSRTFGGTDRDRAWCVQQTSDGGYILAGGTRSFGASVGYRPDAYLIKTDSDGNEVWSRTFGGGDLDVAYCVQQTSDGGYVVAGFTQSFGTGNADVYLIKTDPNGETGKGQGWTKVIDNNGNDQAFSVQQTSDGGYIVGGQTIDSFTYPDVYLLKTDSGGNEVWSQTFGGSKMDVANSIQQTPDGGYIVAGYTTSFGAGGYDVLLMKTDSNGNAPSPE